MVILGVWEAPGAPETLQKGGGEAPRPSEMAPEAPGAAQTPKTTDFRSLTNFKFPPKVQPRSCARGRRSLTRVYSTVFFVPHITVGSLSTAVFASRSLCTACSVASTHAFVHALRAQPISTTTGPAGVRESRRPEGPSLHALRRGPFKGPLGSPGDQL